MQPKALVKYMWGDFALNPQTKKLVKCSPNSPLQPMFVTMILDPIWRMYTTIHHDKNLQKAANMAKRVDVQVTDRDLNPGDLRGTTQNIFRKWFPLAEALLRMVVRIVPNPRDAQKYRLSAFWPVNTQALPPVLDERQSQIARYAIDVRVSHWPYFRIHRSLQINCCAARLKRFEMLLQRVTAHRRLQLLFLSRK